jgi:hypothetical protein
MCFVIRRDLFWEWSKSPDPRPEAVAIGEAWDARHAGDAASDADDREQRTKWDIVFDKWLADVNRINAAANARSLQIQSSTKKEPSEKGRGERRPGTTLEQFQPQFPRLALPPLRSPRPSTQEDTLNEGFKLDLIRYMVDFFNRKTRKHPQVPSLLGIVKWSDEGGTFIADYTSWNIVPETSIKPHRKDF